MPKGIKTTPKGYMKVTKAEKDKRIEEGAERLLSNPDEGFSRFVEWAMDKWGIQKRQAAVYRKEAFGLIGQPMYEGVEAHKKRAIVSLENMLRMSMEQKDPDVKLALSIRQEINKLQGLHVQRVEVNDVTEQPVFIDVPIIQEDNVEIDNGNKED